MLDEREIERIKKEVDSYRNIDILSYVDEMMPWMRPIQHTIIRVSKLLEESNITYALISDYTVNFYGIPYWSRDIRFAVRRISFQELTAILTESHFEKLLEETNCLTILDSQMNNFLVFSSEPEPLRWDDEMVKRLSKTIINTRILALEDYIIILLKRGGLREIDLALKILYKNLENIDRGYLYLRARSINVEEELRELMDKLANV
ncbi:MAG: hypothetical protein QW120_01470 [Nitrososphaerota archaeon]